MARVGRDSVMPKSLPTFWIAGIRVVMGICFAAPVNALWSDQAFRAAFGKSTWPFRRFNLAHPKLLILRRGGFGLTNI